jgi:hypothetical protein
MPKVIHVLGSGDPLDPTNFKQHARLDAGFLLSISQAKLSSCTVAILLMA